MTDGQSVKRGRGRKKQQSNKSDEQVVLETKLADAERNVIKGTLNENTITFLQVGSGVIVILLLVLI